MKCKLTIHGSYFIFYNKSKCYNTTCDNFYDSLSNCNFQIRVYIFRWTNQLTLLQKVFRRKKWIISLNVICFKINLPLLYIYWLTLLWNKMRNLMDMFFLKNKKNMTLYVLQIYFMQILPYDFSKVFPIIRTNISKNKNDIRLNSY